MIVTIFLSCVLGHHVLTHHFDVLHSIDALKHASTSFASVPLRSTGEDPRWLQLVPSPRAPRQQLIRAHRPLEMWCSVQRLGKFGRDLSNARGRNLQTTVGAPLLHCMHRTVRRKPYISSVDPRWRTVGLRVFAARSSAAAYSRTLTPLDRGLVWRPKAERVWFQFIIARGRSSRTTVLHFSLYSASCNILH